MAFREHKATWVTQSHGKETCVQKIQEEWSPLFFLFLFSPPPPNSVSFSETKPCDAVSLYLNVRFPERDKSWWLVELGPAGAGHLACWICAPLPGPHEPSPSAGAAHTGDCPPSWCLRLGKELAETTDSQRNLAPSVGRPSGNILGFQTVAGSEPGAQSHNSHDLPLKS